MHSILALDSSVESGEAMQFFANLPFRQRPQVTIVTALVDSAAGLLPADRGASIQAVEKELASKTYESAKALLGEACDVLPPVVERCHPSRLILEVAKERNADVIVLGNRGHSAPHRALLGSTADFVANHAKCSVLIARPAHKCVASTQRIQVLLAYDGSSESKQAHRQLEQFHWPEDDTSLHLATIFDRPKLVPDDVVYDPDTVRAAEDALTELSAALDVACAKKLHVQEKLHIGNALRSLAKDEGCNLIFIGGSGKSALARFFLGSTSRYLLHHSECRVWIARKKQWDSP